MRGKAAMRAVAAVAVALALGAGVARSAEKPGAVFASGYAYLNSPVVMVEGSELVFVNADASRHSVSALEADAAGNPLFDSGDIGPGEIAEVRGAARLAPRQKPYRFVCIRHSYMKGELHVL